MSAVDYRSAFDADYYASGCGEPYGRSEAWLRFFEGLAERIDEALAPGSVLDAGCAFGFLVEMLRRRGIEAWGLDVSDYAIGQAAPEVAPFLHVGSIAEPLGRRYDLVTCIEVLEHMPAAEAPAAVANLCAHADNILFSSSPLDLREATHLNVRPPEHWAALFARQGFYRDLDFDASFLTPWALRFRKAPDPEPRRLLPALVGAYERRLWQLDQERQDRRALSIEQRQALAEQGRELARARAELEARQNEQTALAIELHAANETLARLRAEAAAWQTRAIALETSPGFTLVQRLQRLRLALAPPGGGRERLLEAALGWKLLLQQQGPSALARHLAREARVQLPYRVRRARRRGRFETVAVPPVALVDPDAGLAGPGPETLDIVICVHDALDDLRACLASLLRHTPEPFGLILVDDGSGPETAAWLDAFAAARPGTRLLRHPSAGGYTLAANSGLAESRADWVLLLNSDTLLTPRWLERLLACGRSDARIGLVGPLSNSATWQSVPELEAAGDWAINALPEGVALDDFATWLAQDSARLYPRLPFLNGFCLLVRRALLDQIGSFDAEAFGAGYGEENDFCLRARAAGWELALADDAYVFHAQSKSYREERRRPLVERADRALVAKHGQAAVAAGVAALRGDRVLAGIRARAAQLAERRRAVAGGRERFGGRRVLFVIPIAAAGGGGSIAMFEMRAMRAMGVETAVFNLNGLRGAFEAAYPGLDLPVVWGEPGDLGRLAADWDAIVATMYTTVDWLAEAARAPEAAGTVFGYFIQDLEAYFYRPGSEAFHAALASYSRLPGIRGFAMTPWNAAELERLLGIRCPAVMPGYDVDLYRPRPRIWPDDPGRPVRVAAMVRPESPYRSPRLTMELLRDIARRHGPHVEVVIFGLGPEHPGFAELPTDFPFTLAGRLNPQQMARLLNEVDIFCDFSTWQAMGMTAMEAMVSGCAVVVTRNGGPDVYARDEENCLMVDPEDRRACYVALDRLVRDPALRRRLAAAGMRDIAGFYPERAAWNMLNALFGPEIDADQAAAEARALAERVDAFALPLPGEGPDGPGDPGAPADPAGAATREALGALDPVLEPQLEPDPEPPAAA